MSEKYKKLVGEAYKTLLTNADYVELNIRLVKLESVAKLATDYIQMLEASKKQLYPDQAQLFKESAEDRYQRLIVAIKSLDEVGESKSYEYNQYFQNMTKEGLLDMIESYLKCERRLK